jgi:hypothetical protein
MAEVMNLIYQKELNEGVEDGGVAVVYGDSDISNAIGALFDGPKPYFGMLDKLRDFGIKDWDKFKLLWKEQYASQIGIILQEEAQKKVKKIFETARAGEDAVWEAKKAAWEQKEAEFQKEMQEYKSRRSTKNPIKRWLLNRTFEKPPERVAPHSETFEDKQLTDTEVRKRIVDGLLNQAKEGGKEKLTADAFNTLTRLMATAMREINLEIKVSEADTEQEKNRLLGEANRSADQYVDHNGQFYIKNMDQRASREATTEEDEAEVDPAMYTAAYNELADLMNEMNDILNEMQKGPVSKAKADKIAEAAKNLRAAFEGQDGADKMQVRVLGEDFTMQDEAKDLLHEHTKLRDRERKTESFRVARDIIKERGKEIAKASKVEVTTVK